MAINFINSKLNTKIIAFGLMSIFIYSCGNQHQSEEASNDDIVDNDTIKNVALNVGGELFSIPSPMQTASLIQKSGVSYDKAILNPGNKNGQYSSDYFKALNLGVYGADLGYVSMYNQTQDAIGYLSAVKNLADKLGVSSAFDQTTMQRIQTNISNKDSMLSLVSIAYRASDAYLKTNKRTEISSLILTGGWIESMYFSIAAFKKKPTDEIKNRIAQQNQALISIIKLLGSHNLPDANDLISHLESLAKIYEGVTIKYNFVEPTTDANNKITIINSTTEFLINKEQIDEIADKIFIIRDKIINAKS